MGRDVAQYHQVQAFFEQHGIDSEQAHKKKIKVSDIKSNIHPADCFLSGENLKRYLHDMNIINHLRNYAELFPDSKWLSEEERIWLNRDDDDFVIYNY